MVDAAIVDRAVEGVDCIFHEAALASVQWSIDRPLDSHAACCTGTVNILDAARRWACGGWFSRPRQPPTAISPSAASERPTCRSDFALCGGEAGLGELLPRLLGHLQAGDGGHPVFQRLRAAAGPRQPLFGGDSAFHHGHARRPAAGHLRRRPAVAQLHLRSQRRACQPAGGRRPRRCRPGLERGQRQGHRSPHADRHAERLLGTEVQPRHAPARVGDVRESLADISQARKFSATNRPSTSTRACGGPSIITARL